MIKQSSLLHQHISAEIFAAFKNYRSHFRELTFQADTLFLRREWWQLQKLSARRIDLYDHYCVEVYLSLKRDYEAKLKSESSWAYVASHYQKRVSEREDSELANTFFNSVYAASFDYLDLSEHRSFLLSEKNNNNASQSELFVSSGVADVENTLTVLVTGKFGQVGIVGMSALKRCLLHRVGVVSNEMKAAVEVELFRQPLIRDKGCYLIGRLFHQSKTFPLAIALRMNNNDQLQLDAVLTTEDDLSILFSFAHSYFWCDLTCPLVLVSYLCQLLPAKSISELYTALGYHKQGKAELFLDFQRHLESSQQLLITAPGVKGMVMLVFMLPGYDVVFKLIRDRFASSKRITRDQVREKYLLVKHHDRVGRMADTQEFINFAFPKRFFAGELIEQLSSEAASSITINETTVVIKHLWIERAMCPLNLYIETLLENNDMAGLRQIIDEYGCALKELAAVNIFAGDMLFKNFGVTRHKRVVFYDYDEVSYLTDCHFRKIPEPLYPEQELAGEPWYSVAEGDVFPEEFSIILSFDPAVDELFKKLHGDLLTAEGWLKLQSNIDQQAGMELFPYKKSLRFDPC